MVKLGWGYSCKIKICWKFFTETMVVRGDVVADAVRRKPDFFIAS